MSHDLPFEERRHDNRLVDWRMEKMESQQADLARSLDGMKEFITDKFAELRKELFENPTFVTMLLLRTELETRDAKIARMEREQDLKIARLESEHNGHIEEIKMMIRESSEAARIAAKENSDKSISSKRFSITTALGAVAVAASIAVAIFFRG